MTTLKDVAKKANVSQMTVSRVFNHPETVSDELKDSEVQAFTLNFTGPWTLNNFSELFSDTLYGRWYLNTLVISFFTMVIQVAVVTLAGYTYSRYNFAGKICQIRRCRQLHYLLEDRDAFSQADDRRSSVMGFHGTFWRFHDCQVLVT